MTAAAAEVDLSVIIPVHNGESFICEAIDSALAQAGVSLEVIVVDNLSRDRTSDVVRAAYSRSVILAAEPRPGAAAARNAGVRLATGRYLAFLDADDVWLDGKIERQMRELLSRQGTDMVFTYCQEFHDASLTPAQQNRFPCRPPYAFAAPSTAVLSRKVFDRVGEFPDVPGGEFIAWYGWARSLGLGSFVVPEVLVRRRIHGANTTLQSATLAAYPAAAKWLLDQRRQANQARKD